MSPAGRTSLKIRIELAPVASGRVASSQRRTSLRTNSGTAAMASPQSRSRSQAPGNDPVALKSFKGFGIGGIGRYWGQS